LISHTPLTEASQGMLLEDLPPLMIRLNSLLHFGDFSLKVLLLLQKHFLQRAIKIREKKKEREKR
jgi:hypothetical protein